MEKDIRDILLESVWVMRWNEDKTAMVAVLTSEEAIKIVDDIIKNLNKHNYIITKQPK